MATQTIEFRAATGLTITAKLFSAGSDTEVASVSATEATNRIGTYSAAYTDVAAGEYALIALSSGTPVASWWVTLTLTTATFQVYERSNLAGLALEATAQNIQSRLPAALVSGRMDASVGAMAANTLTASALASDAVTEIQSGLALEATVQALDLSVTVTPLAAGDTQRVDGTDVVAYIGEVSDITVYAVTDVDGNAVNLSTKTLRIYIQELFGGDVIQTIEDAAITVSGGNNNDFTFTPSSDVTETRRKLDWSLRDVNDGEKVLAHGTLDVQNAAWSA